MNKRVKIYAIDFDGTIVEDKWPQIGELNRPVYNFIRGIQDLGCQWVLWTCRNGKQLQQAIDFCMEHGLVPTAINENVPDIVIGKGINPRKVYADIYIDDHVPGGKPILPPIPKTKYAHEE